MENLLVTYLALSGWLDVVELCTVALKIWDLCLKCLLEDSKSRLLKH